MSPGGVAEARFCVRHDTVETARLTFRLNAILPVDLAAVLVGFDVADRLLRLDSAIPAPSAPTSTTTTRLATIARERLAFERTGSERTASTPVAGLRMIAATRFKSASASGCG